MTVRIKFCGLTRVEDTRTAVELGVDAIGLVFTRASRRFVDIEQACAIRRAIPPFVSAVALFMNDTDDWIAEVIERVQPDLLQFHGEESDAFAAGFSRHWIKAVPMASVVDFHTYASLHPGAGAFLLDSHAGGMAGGSGEVFDWARVPRQVNRPIVLAGGLDAANVAQAIEVVRPYAVDVSSGIEQQPGIKDAGKMQAFVVAARRAANALTH